MKNLAERFPVAVFILGLTTAAISTGVVILVISMSLPVLLKVFVSIVFGLIAYGFAVLAFHAVSVLRSRDE